MTDTPIEDLEPDEGPDPEEYEPDEEDVAVSGDTGTVYEEGEPAVTPRDAEPTEDED